MWNRHNSTADASKLGFHYGKQPWAMQASEWAAIDTSKIAIFCTQHSEKSPWVSQSGMVGSGSQPCNVNWKWQIVGLVLTGHECIASALEFHLCGSKPIEMFISKAKHYWKWAENSK